MKLLHIKVSPDLAGSASRTASSYLVDKLKLRHPALVETVIDLSRDPLPHLDAFTIGAFFTPADSRTAEQCEAIATSEYLVDQQLEPPDGAFTDGAWRAG